MEAKSLGSWGRVDLLLAAFCFCVVLSNPSKAAEIDPIDWTERELALIKSLSLSQLPPPPLSPSNKYANDPSAAALGRAIFHDTRFSANGNVSCGTCHRQDYGFTDDLPQGIGIDVASRRTMPIVGMAYQKWFFWDGRADSLWSQTLGPLENPVEHGIDRYQVRQLVMTHYLQPYQQVFDGDAKSQSVNQVFANIGKALAAHVRTVLPEITRFDLYADALRSGSNKISILTTAETRGLRLFVSKAKCVNCHNGPMFTNGEFHHSGTPENGEPDAGRGAAFHDLEATEFGFFGKWSDADPQADGDHIRFLDRNTHKYAGTFKTPTLRGVSDRPPYMHNGAFNSLAQVLNNYRAVSGSTLADEVFHGDLTDRDLVDLEAFLGTLSSNSNDIHN
ncbi:Cytochrome c551 peroxidase precursor [Falsiruegeria litorea R37]|uniref:Cytochrome c551 peroxidase n=1 Tax=Falsiruegeria litorea R37 TaxID=1200284 RepID=A0A1Y5R9L2_9RHOB|nr:cytochrome c peroxidase [Falsiruegeria litorea]SLN11165.1 Cytochrome c551 peroxidase precursor [Falsiruegeria litorea R37]